MIWEIMFGLLLIAAVAGAVFVLTPFVKAYLAEKSSRAACSSRGRRSGSTSWSSRTSMAAAGWY